MIDSAEELAGRIKFLDHCGKRSFCIKCGTRVWTIKDDPWSLSSYCYVGPIDEWWHLHGRPGKECGTPCKPGEDPIARLTYLDLCKFCGQDVERNRWRPGSPHRWNFGPLRLHVCRGTIARDLRWKKIKEGAFTSAAIAVGIAFWVGVAALRVDILSGIDWLLGLVKP